MHFPVPRPRTGMARFVVLALIVSATAAGASVVVPIPDAIVPTSEPVLVGAVYVGMGLVVLWFAKLGIDLKSSAERLLLRVEDPQTGLVVQLASYQNETRGALGVLSNELEEVKQQVAGVEATCAATHSRANGA